MRLAAVVMLAGCFGKPSFTHRDAESGDDAPGGEGGCTASKPSAPGLTLNLAPTDTTATMLDGSQIGFPSVLNHYPMPDRLIVNGTNLVAPPEGCAFEDRVGVAVFPIFSIAAQSPTGGTVHALDQVVTGPAFTMLHSFWSFPVPSSCGGGATTARGDTTWSIFPDGKVVRNDTIAPADMTTLTPTGCQCSGAAGITNFILTSYTTLRTSNLNAITMAGQPEGQSIPADGTTIQAARGACARSGGGKLALWWDRVEGADLDPAPTRVRVNPLPGTHDMTAFVYDMITAGSNQTTIIDDDEYRIRTHMLLTTSALPCTDLLSTLESFVTISPMTINGTGIAYSPLGVFDDARVFSEPAMISGTLPAGFVVRLRFASATAVSTNRPADRVIWQRQPDGSFFLFFKDGLGPASPITVTPECGP